MKKVKDRKDCNVMKKAETIKDERRIQEYKRALRWEKPFRDG